MSWDSGKAWAPGSQRGRVGGRASQGRDQGSRPLLWPPFEASLQLPGPELPSLSSVLPCPQSCIQFPEPRPQDTQALTPTTVNTVSP